MEFKIEVDYSERTGYAVYLNGEVIMECLTEDDLKTLTIKEILEVSEANY